MADILRQYPYDAGIQHSNESIRRCRIGKVYHKPTGRSELGVRVAAIAHKELASLRESIEASTGKWDIFRK